MSSFESVLLKYFRSALSTWPEGRLVSLNHCFFPTISDGLIKYISSYCSPCLFYILKPSLPQNPTMSELDLTLHDCSEDKVNSKYKEKNLQGVEK